ncbi:MAG: ABC transporter ATP-binding protein [Bacteroidales bacterium]|nr:ABC transporter ATP-binding protein [Bacteroidales bacterium]
MKDLKTCLKGLWNMSSPYRGLMLTTVFVGTLRICCSLTFVWVCKRLIDIVTGESSAPLYASVVILCCVMLGQIGCGIAYSYIQNLNSMKCRNRLREDFFSHVLSSGWNGKEEFHTGDTVNRLEEDVRVVAELLCERIPAVGVTLLQLAAASVYMLFLEPSLLWLILVMMLLMVGCSKLYFKKIRQLTAEIRADDSLVQQLVQENLQNRVLVLTLFGVGNVVSKMSGVQDHLQKKTVERLNFNAVARGFMQIGFTGGYAVAFLWGLFGILHGTVTFGMMTSFLQLVGQIQRPVADLSTHIPAFIKSVTSVERLLELLDLEVEVSRGDVFFEDAPGVRVEDVTFSYDSIPVLEHFSHDFAPGSLTVINGPTGVGKSTLTRLVLGLLKPLSGRVSVYSAKQGEVACGVDTRCNFTYVPQGDSLMSGTIRENMLFACPDATEEDIREALTLSAAEFVYSLEDGLDTVCGEKGTGLSVGQCQRIAVARAILHKGGVLILDEATSALDLDTEARLLDNIRERCSGKRTVIFISHRQAASRIADCVISLNTQA